MDETLAAGSVTAVICARTPLFVEGVSALLAAQGVRLVGGTCDLPTLRGVVYRADPDVVVLIAADGRGGETDIFGTAEQIRVDTRSSLLILGHRIPPVEVARQLLSGTRRVGFLDLESLSARRLAEALRSMVASGVAVDPALFAHLYRPPTNASILSPRESRVWSLLGSGLSNLGIAESLGIAEGTVEKHCSSLLAKLHVDPDPLISRRVVAALRFGSPQR